MLITIAVIIIVLATFMLIMYNMYSDYQNRRAADSLATMNHSRNIITETEELLYNQASVPLSKVLVLVLRYRILNNLKKLKQDPNIKNVDPKIEEQLKLINDVKSGYKEELAFKAPENDAAAIQQLRAVRKIRKIIHQEMRAGTPVPRTECVKEDKRLSVLVLKINISNLIQRVYELKRLHQIGTCRQLIEKGLEVIQRSGVHDEWLASKSAVLAQLQAEIEKEVKDSNKAGQAKAAFKSEETKEIEQLFGEKKKW